MDAPENHSKCGEYMKNLQEKIKAIQNTINTASDENVELLYNVLSANKECDKQKNCMNELLNINEELLHFCQERDSEIQNTKSEIERAGQEVESKTEENRLLIRRLSEAKREMEEQRCTITSIRSRLPAMKRDLLENEFEFTTHETAVKILNDHLSSGIKSQDDLLEEEIKLEYALVDTYNSNQALGIQLCQSWKLVEELEAKLDGMASNASHTMTDLAFVKEQNDCFRKEVTVNEQTSQCIQKEIMDIQGSILQLEDQIMEKDGQIAILRDSYPEDDEF